MSRLRGIGRVSGLTLLALGVCVLAGAAVAVLVAKVGIDDVAQTWARWRPVVVAVKWAVLIGIVVYWHRVARGIGAWLDLADGDVARLQGQRWRVAVALAVLELVFGQNLLARLLAD